MSPNVTTIQLTPTVKVPVPESKGNLQGRVVTKTPESKGTAWEKICRLFEELIAWVKNLFKKEDAKIEKLLEKLPPPDLAYLRPKDPAYNVKRLSEIGVSNATQSVCSEEIVKSLPKTNPYYFGYDDAEDYRTVLGDRFIAAQTGLTALSIIGASLWPKFTCLADGDRYDPKLYHNCTQMAAQVWQNVPGQTFLTGSALLLGASLYAHRKGWLGALMHDRSLGWRQRKIEALFNDAAQQLTIQGATNLDEGKKTAEKIMGNRELILATLRVELQLPEQKAKEIVEILNRSCKEILAEPPPQVISPSAAPAAAPSIPQAIPSATQEKKP